jgi:hypothetical protein
MEENVKKAHLSPVTSLLMSLSLALGILVCNLSDYGFLTRVHASAGSCATVVGGALTIDNARAPNGVVVANIIVNGQLIEAGVIAGSVQLVNSDVTNANGIIVGNGGDPTETDGIIVGNGAPCIDGIIVGNGGDPTQTDGIIVGNGGDPTVPNGIIVGNGIGVSGYIVSASGTAIGGTLTGDNITVTDGGVITGHNLLLSGSTIDGGFINVSGTITGVSITPVN